MSSAGEAGAAAVPTPGAVAAWGGAGADALEKSPEPAKVSPPEEAPDAADVKKELDDVAVDENNPPEEPAAGANRLPEEALAPENKPPVLGAAPPKEAPAACCPAAGSG